MSRPKKYIKDSQRKIAKKVSDRKSQLKIKRISGKYFRLVIPSIQRYGTSWKYTDQKIQDLKASVIDLLHMKQKSRGLDQYMVAVERHPGNNLAHLDIFLIYKKRIFNLYNSYDYIIKHGHLTKYRTLNKAILEYGLKEDPSPLGNLNIQNLLLSIKASDKQGLYQILESAMLKCPFNFSCDRYIHKNNLNKYVIETSWQNIYRQVQRKHAEVCNEILMSKPGIREITPELIKQKLSDDEFKTFKSWSGYQVIVDHINQIPLYGCCRPHKTKNLLLVGRPNTGKTRLALEIEKYTAVYYKDVSNWFPKYKCNTYKMVLWNEFSLRGLKYPKLLNFLEGAKMDLEYKGGSVLKTDNQLVYMTSNIPLDIHINTKFKSCQYRAEARKNLRARITEVIIPCNLDLFLLLKLLIC